MKLWFYTSLAIIGNWIFIPNGPFHIASTVTYDIDIHVAWVCIASGDIQWQSKWKFFILICCVYPVVVAWDIINCYDSHCDEGTMWPFQIFFSDII